MSSEKEKEAFGNHEDEKQVLKEGAEDGHLDNSASAENNMAHDLDSSRAHFIKKEKEHEAHVDIEGNTKLVDNFVGMSKEELQKYADDPYWKKVRLVMLILFWVAWVGMLVAAVVIIVVAPKCPPRPKQEWYQKSNMYQAFARSFKDSDGDGVGDLKGVYDKVNYLKDLNVKALLLSSIYSSENKDFGQDVTDHMKINPEYGTEEDFDDLRRHLHKNGIKLVMDFIPNHTSKKHLWFQESVAKNGKYTDYYVWKEGDKNTKPNNWKTVYKCETAWTWDNTRGAWYLHQLSSELPDLNLRNEEVQKDLSAVLQFWLDKKVDGFVVHNAAHLYESLLFEDQLTSATERCGYELNRTTFQPESYQQMVTWATQLSDYVEVDDEPKLLMAAVEGTANQTMMFMKYQGEDGAQLTTSSALGRKFNKDCRAHCIRDLTAEWAEGAVSAGVTNTWMTGSSDLSRLASRTAPQGSSNEKIVNAMNLLLMTLPGTVVSYYGEEIGMHDVEIKPSEAQDKLVQLSRDPERTPMQWTPDTNAGFSSGNSTWLPLPPDFGLRNVKTQNAHGKGCTNVKVFANVSALSDKESIQFGSFKLGVAGSNNNVLFYVRQAERFPGYLVAINFGDDEATVDFVKNAPEDKLVPKEARIVASTCSRSSPEFAMGVTAPLDNLHLLSYEGVVFQWDAGAAEKAEL